MTPDDPVDPVVVARIDEALRADLRPARPVPSTGALVAMLFAVFAAIAVLGAYWLGFYGARRLGAAALAAILVPLAGQALLLAEAGANAMVPGSRRAAHPGVLAGAACLLMIAIFAALFRDYRTDSFVRQGVSCLKAGLLWAAPAALGAWLVLRRGFAVDSRAAGVAIGALGGLAGLAVLELHCPNFRLAHIAVWHIAGVPVAAVAGYFLGSKRRAAELMQ
jgi:hypothetical protein